MTKGEIAKNYFLEGYNCAQAVALAFKDEMNMTTEEVARMASSFGGGMGKLREVCGAVSGMFMVAGVLFGYDDPKDYEAKAKHYEMIQHLGGRFKEMNGSIVCRELLGLDKKEENMAPSKRTSEYYKKRPCGDLVFDAATILEEYINENVKKQ